jgi:N-acyl-D-aspartate/D-glutamate deacylase
MGERGADHEEETTEGDLKAMHMVVKQALEAGAIGVASHRADGHQDMSGNPVPGTFAKDPEVVNIARAVNAAGGGLFECVSGFLMDNSLTIALKERELYEAISTAGGPNMPIVFNIHRKPISS